jgi:hypothetical protein
MSEDFKPGTRPLLRLAGLDAERPFVSRDDENDALWTVVLALMMRLYLDPDPESRRSAGAADSQVVGALRAALGENFGIEAGDYIAWALVHYGCRQKPTLASLQPWEQLMFEWQERHATTPRVALLLRAVGFSATLAASSLESLDGWIANPATALGQGPAIVAAMFGPRLVIDKPRDDGFGPGHDVLFHALLRSAMPPIAIDSLRQRSQAGGGGSYWVIEYAQGGRDWAFNASANGNMVDIDAVMDAVDALMERLGRPDRVFRLPPGQAGEGAHFVVADAARFEEMINRLRLPLLRSPKSGTQPPAEASRLPEALPARADSQASTAAGAPSSFLPLDGGQSMFETTDPGMVPADTDADAALRSMIVSLRRSFGAGRLLQGGRWAKQSQASPPAALAGDPVGVVYTHLPQLIRKGRIVWGALVLADEALFAPGAGDRPVLLVFSHDEHYDARPAELAALGARIASLRGARPSAPGLRELVAQLRNDSGRPLGVPLPASLAPREVTLTSAMVIRSHLPDGFLAGDWFPLLTHTSSAVPLIVPSPFWPQALRAAWDARQLVSPARRRAVARA